MLRYILFDLELFDDDTSAGRENSRKRTLALLEALTLCNQFYLSAHPETPLIYQSRIKYKVPAQYKSDEDVDEVGTVRKWLEENNAPRRIIKAVTQLEKMCGGERFREIPRILENGGGDCDNVASWRCAELRQLGVPAKPYITWRQRADGGTTYHVVVLYPDGTHEDPSLLLGMGGAERAADRYEEERKLGERTGEFLTGQSKIFGVPHDMSQVTNWAGSRAMDRARNRHTTILGGISAVTPFSAQGSTPSDFGQGLQYTIPFQTDDSYESWSPTRPQAYYANPLYPGGLVSQSGPIFNTLMRDADDEFDFDDRMDRFDGEVTPADERRWERELRRLFEGCVKNAYARIFAEAFGLDEELFLHEDEERDERQPLGDVAEYGLGGRSRVARGDSLLDDGDEAALKSELPGVDDARWTQFVRAMVCADCDAVSDSNQVGMFQLSPRRLHDLGLVKDISRGKGPTGRTIYVAVFVPPLTASKFLKNPDEQYRAFSKSCKDYARKISDGQIQKEPGMSLSGALAILHRAGPMGLDTWARGERFPSTVEKFTRISGVF